MSLHSRSRGQGQGGRVSPEAGREGVRTKWDKEGVGTLIDERSFFV